MPSWLTFTAVCSSPKPAITRPMFGWHATSAVTRSIEQRLAELATAEAAIIEEGDVLPRMHS